MDSLTEFNACDWAKAVLEVSDAQANRDIAINLGDQELIDVLMELKRLGCRVDPSPSGYRLYRISRGKFAD
jgi:hypothetical protein